MPSVKTITTDIAIMGSGLAGLSAAVKAAEAGSRVAVFEKRPFQGGGVSNTPMMTLVVRDDQAYKDKAFKVHMEYTNYSADAAVVRSWIDNSSHIPAFVNGLGIDFLHTLKFDLETLGQPPRIQRRFSQGDAHRRLLSAETSGQGARRRSDLQAHGRHGQEAGRGADFNAPVKIIGGR